MPGDLPGHASEHPSDVRHQPTNGSAIGTNGKDAENGENDAFSKGNGSVSEKHHGSNGHLLLEEVLETADVAKLTHAQRKALVEHALNTLDQDNEGFLSNFAARLERVGVAIPTVEVRFEDIHVEAGVYVGDRSVPTLPNYMRDVLSQLPRTLHLLRDSRQRLPILNGCSGILKPGRLTLLLGPPGAGKSTLLQALAGLLPKDVKFLAFVSRDLLHSSTATSHHDPLICRVLSHPLTSRHLSLVPPLSIVLLSTPIRVCGLSASPPDITSPPYARQASGTVTYNGHEPGEFYLPHTAAYVPQTQAHIGEMTVRETFDFAARMQGPAYRKELVTEVEEKEKEAGVTPDPIMQQMMRAMALEGSPTSVLTDYIVHILGLDVCADTVVGSALRRGISGGQKKRVATGEALVSAKQVLLMDEISTGLDSSTTFLITRCLRHISHLHRATTLVALLQPAPETYELFDDVLLLAEGHVIFHGPREDVLPFFNSLGFQCPPRKAEADFLQEVLSVKDQGQYWANTEQPHRFIPAQALAAAFSDTQRAKEQQAQLSTPFPKESSPKGALEHRQYVLTAREIFDAMVQRQLLLFKRTSFIYFASIAKIILMALVTSTVFLFPEMNVTVAGGQIYLGAIFFGLIVMLFNGGSETPILIERLPIFYRERDALLYPAWSYAIPMALICIPYSAALAVAWTSIVYFLVGFAPNADRFFAQMLMWFLIHQVGMSLFRFVASVGRSRGVANTFGTFALIVLFLLGGFVIAKENIPPWWIWAYWMSPLAYAQNALAVNEFKAPRWQVPVPGSNMTMGDIVLTSRSLPTEDSWRWIGIGAFVGFILVFNTLTILALTFLNLHPSFNNHAPTLNPPPLPIPIPIAPSPFHPAITAYAAEQQVVSEEQLQARHMARTGEMMDEKKHSRGSRKRSKSRGSRSSGALDKYRKKSVDASADASAVAEAGEAGVRGMVLPFEPLSLSFSSVNYYVDMPAEMKEEGAEGDRLQLLRNVSGAFRPKVLTALVGVSGAGKTTLMDVLAGRKTGGYIEGDVRVSGYPKVHETFARVSGYCEQDDIHTPQVTVYESLLYSAWLRLPQDVDKDVREDFVEEVMELVELEALRGSIVGLPGVNGLSTEQRKRLTIAVELVANPSIIFMDEPTSGLDARAAAIVMRTVRNTVNTGRTVLCTIHQPSIDIFEAFDELLLMTLGGQVIYFGPLGVHSQHLIDYFQAVPSVPRIPTGYNPATWMLDITTPAASERTGVDFVDLYHKSDLFRRNQELVESLKTPPPGQQDLHFATEHSTSLVTQFYVNLWKRSAMYWRAPDYNAVRYIFCTVFALLIGLVFFGLGKKTATMLDIFNVMGALYTTSIFMAWNNSAAVQPLVAVERTVYYREKAAGLYGALPYAFAQGLIELPYVLVQTFLYCIITYALVQFEWTAAKFWWYFLFMFITLFCFVMYGLLAISITPNEQLAMLLSSFFVPFWNLLCGFIVPRPQIPVWWQWFYWLTPISYSLYGLIESQLGDITTPIQVDGVAGNQTVESFLTDYFGFQYWFLPYAALILVALTIVFFCCYAYAVRKINFQRR
ncbi:unnamed protein product [Closterium sp. NIES-65]|nr:unnamed protein product [Closterium sp. NIES-65]